MFRARDTSDDSRQIETVRLDLRSGALSVISSVEMQGPHHGGYTLLAVEPISRSLYHVTTERLQELMVVYRYAIQSDGALRPRFGSRVLSLGEYPAVFVPFGGPRG